MPQESDVGDARTCGGGARANHACWVYTDASEFHARVTAFLRHGLAAGQRVVYMGSDRAATLRRRLRAVRGLGALCDRGDVEVRSLEDWYVQADDPGAQVAVYARAAREAVAAGYTGLRVAVEATDLVHTATQRETFARYEHLVDRCLLDEPFTAMCGYDGAELGEHAAELACLHPRTSPGAASFQWWAANRDDMGLSGEIDVASVDLFDLALARTMPLLARPRLAVDAHELAFIDHRGLLTLERHALAADMALSLHTDASAVHRLASLLDLKAVRVQP